MIVPRAASIRHQFCKPFNYVELWWKLKKEDCCEEFREEIRRALGGKEGLPDD